MKRLTYNKVERPAGWIRRRKTYSLILSDQGLFIIETGPASDKREEMAKFFNKKYSSKIDEGEKRLKTESLEKLVTEKGNFLIKLNEIKSPTISKSILEKPILNFKSHQGKFEFRFQETNMKDIEKLKQIFQ